MKHIAALILLLGVWTGVAASRPLANETVGYRIMYKWGLIHKQAGSAEISLKSTRDGYSSQLVAHSAKWVDKFFTVRDTLNGTMGRDDYRPFFYEKIAREGGDYKHDTVKFTYGPQGSVTGLCTRIEYKDGVLKKDTRLTLKATGTVVDMLSSYFYVRTLPYDTWQAGHRDRATIFSGKEKESLTFEYKGVETIEMRGRRFKCYHVTFVFTGNNGAKSSDNMDAWITADSKRTAVKISGKLPVGKVHCELDF